jgi:hypothetical protein
VEWPVVAEVQVVEPAAEEAEAGWAVKDWELAVNVYALNAEKRRPISGGYPAMSRNVQSAIHP